MKRITIENAAKKWVYDTTNQIHPYARLCSIEAFIAGTYWCMRYLCKIPINEAILELHDFYKKELKNKNG